MFGDSGLFGFGSLCEVFQLDLLFVDSVAAFFSYLLSERSAFADEIILFTDDIQELVRLLILFILGTCCGFCFIGCAVGCSDDWGIIRNEISTFALV